MSGKKERITASLPLKTAQEYQLEPYYLKNPVLISVRAIAIFVMVSALLVIYTKQTETWLLVPSEERQGRERQTKTRT
ncbi:MAG: hypothetical protein AB1861_28890 [Cyanobacteriota bacterium]